MAIGAYPCSTAASITRLRATSAGVVTVAVGGHEMGQGLRTAVTETVVADFSVAPEDVVVDLGDTRGVPQHLTAGAWGTATVLPGVQEGLAALRRRLLLPASGPVDVAAAVGALAQGEIEVEVEVEVDHLGPGQPPDALGQLRSGAMAIVGPEYPDFTAFSYAAHFVEVRVEPTTRRVRVGRVVSVADCGRVASPVTAASQLRGGVLWGIGAALREVSDVDPRYGGFLNADLEDYVLLVNADLPPIDVHFVGEPDPLLNPLGVKTLGEVSMVGVAPAVTNALFHATGRRHAHLPVRLEDML